MHPHDRSNSGVWSVGRLGRPEAPNVNPGLQRIGLGRNPSRRTVQGHYFRIRRSLGFIRRRGHFDRDERLQEHGHGKNWQRAHRMRAMTARTAWWALSSVVVIGAILVVMLVVFVALHGCDGIGEHMRYARDLHGGHGHDEPHQEDDQMDYASSSERQTRCRSCFAQRTAIVCSRRNACRCSGALGDPTPRRLEQTAKHAEHRHAVRTNAERRKLRHLWGDRVSSRLVHASSRSQNACLLYEMQRCLSTEGCAEVRRTSPLFSETQRLFPCRISS